jgi:hypothetical protein
MHIVRTVMAITEAKPLSRGSGIIISVENNCGNGKVTFFLEKLQ